MRMPVYTSHDLWASTTVAVSEMQAKIDEARDVAAALIDAFDRESSPPAVAAQKARAWLGERIEAAE